MPGAAVVVEDDDGRVLLGRRADLGSWSLPTGGAEEGSSFARTAVAEVAEDTGLGVDEADLVAFASYSDGHLVAYPNGDVTNWFTLCFVARRWSGTVRADGDETTAVGFFPRDEPPGPLQDSTAAMLALYERFLATGRFQAA